MDTNKALDWFWGLILGDFNEDPDAAQIVIGAVIGSLPIIGQAADIRDVCANCYQLSKDPKDSWKWIALVITLLAFIPGVGDALKGIAKLAMQALKSGGAQAAERIRDILALVRGLGKGDPVKWLQNLPWGEYQSQVVGFWRKVTGNLLQAMESVGNSWIARWAIGHQNVESLEQAARMIRKLRELGESEIPQAFTRLRGAIDDLLKRAEPEKLDGSSGTKNVLQHSSKPLMRIQYELEVKQIADRANAMRAAGKSEAEVAEYAVAERRKIGLKFKEQTEPRLREIIYGRNQDIYGDELGPLYTRTPDGKAWQYKKIDKTTRKAEYSVVSDEKAIKNATQAGGDDFPWAKVLEFDSAVKAGDAAKQSKLIEAIKKLIDLNGRLKSAQKAGKLDEAAKLQAQIDELLLQ
ncbi:hypothetical protein OOT46_02455 [Aquabacterium sp. A7-Y]|uniref:hypothetical protein n=1 Tax=Aquabacterium sp. A7-Y TaxID=1349605 RepID=UPI00223E2E03|nr:hypothetical protein [Aquabacterium sp. A7-Y]MCW7536715.1 hypothetical protein [Aquabacterium sp. A7-Y]